MSVYAIEEEDMSDSSDKKKTETKSDITTTTSQDNPSNTGKPDISSTPGETNDKNTVNQPTETPKVDDPATGSES